MRFNESWLGAHLRRIVPSRLISALLPQDCALCGADAQDKLLCRHCTDALPALPSLACPRCLQPTTGGEICGACLRHPPDFDRLLAAYPYSFPINRLIQQLKYQHILAYARWFGEALAVIADGLEADMIVPMPLHRSRLRNRGFNQAIEIARPLACKLRLPIASEVCVRQRATAPQENLNMLARRRNLRNAFICTADLSGQRILLVDDVVTTGASINECARTLQKYGAVQVTVIAVARTLH